MSGDEKYVSNLSEEQLDNLLFEWSCISEFNNTANELDTLNDTDPNESGDTASSTEPNGPKLDLDFQSVFLRENFSKSQILRLDKQKSTNGCPMNKEMDFESQMDVESFVTTYKLLYSDKEKRKNAENPMPPDFESFLECREYLVTIQCSSSESTSNKGAKNNRFKLGPLPLLIEDILQIELNDKFFGQQSIYGQNFRTVMFYGRCIFIKNEGRNNDNSKCYVVDDGTESIIVRYSHGTSKYHALQRGIKQLCHKYEIACKEGIAFLGHKDYDPTTPVCQNMLQNLNILINVIKRNADVTQNHFHNGSKVCVIGTPFRFVNDPKIRILAFEMFEDGDANRDMEINFKRLLCKLYRTKYLKFTKNDEPRHSDAKTTQKSYSFCK